MSVILPVIDLKRGQVVHGFAGQRDEYRPIQSELVDSPHPGRVAKAISDYVGSKDVYLADLDAIGGDEPDWNNYASILNQSVELWIDAGTGELASIQVLAKRVACRIVIALESLKSLRSLESMVAAFSDKQKLVFSLDMDAEQPMVSDAAASRLSPETIASYAVDSGITTMIVLDVAAVGTGNATTVDLCRKIKSRYPDLEIVSGGGVRNQRDVQRFVDAGCDRVLVATAIHRQAI